MLQKYNKTNKCIIKYYKIYGMDIYGDFIYKKKVNWKSYILLITHILNKPIKIIKQKNSKYKKKKIILKQSYKNKKKVTLKYLNTLFINRYKLLYNNISSQYIKNILIKKIKYYKAKFISFIFLWEKRIDTILNRLHIITNFNTFKQQLQFKKIVLLNNQVTNKYNSIIKDKDTIKIRYDYRVQIMKAILIRQKFQLEWILLNKVFILLKKIPYWKRKPFIEKLLHKDIFKEIPLKSIGKKRKPRRSTMYKPLLYNYPKYFEVNWRTLEIRHLLININVIYDIPSFYKLDLDSIYNLNL